MASSSTTAPSSKEPPAAPEAARRPPPTQPHAPAKPFAPSWYDSALILALDTAASLATAPPPPPSPSQPIRLVCISDTHGWTPDVPDGDILIHAGDMSARGHRLEIQAQLDWLASLPHKHKVVVAGNHDLELDPALPRRRNADPDLPPRGPGGFKLHDLHYLDNASVELSVGGRVVRVFGAPNIPRIGPFGFQYPRTEDRWAGVIPDNTDVVVTHGPPQGFLDEVRGRPCGCASLAREIRRVRPQVHVFGHIHEGHGVAEIVHSDAAKAGAKARAGDVPGLLETAGIVVRALAGRVWPAQPSVTRLVNAASVDVWGQLREPAYIVVDI